MYAVHIVFWLPKMVHRHYNSPSNVVHPNSIANEKTVFFCFLFAGLRSSAPKFLSTFVFVWMRDGHNAVTIDGMLWCMVSTIDTWASPSIDWDLVTGSSNTSNTIRNTIDSKACWIMFCTLYNKKSWFVYALRSTDLEGRKDATTENHGTIQCIIYTIHIQIALWNGEMRMRVKVKWYVDFGCDEDSTSVRHNVTDGTSES